MWVPRARDVTDHPKKCAIKLKPGRGGRKKKKDSPNFWISRQGGRVLFPEKMGKKLGEENSLLI